MTIEQVINGNGTAHYISIQLKTGFGNVYTNKDGSFTYYIDDEHYHYWLGSPLPVIFVLCDPNSNTLYWQQIKLSKISSTPKSHKIVINREHTLGSHSIPELNSIIDAYHPQFHLPETFEEDKNDIEYWTELLETCKNHLSDATKELDRIHSKYDNILNRERSRLNYDNRYKVKRTLSRDLSLVYNVGKMRFSSLTPIITTTFIESLRCAEAALIESSYLENDIYTYVVQNLEELLSSLKSTITYFHNSASKFQRYNGHSNDLDRAEAAFGMVIEDYAARLRTLDSVISSLLIKIKK